ncbi:peptidase domain-containing ABC transporter [Stenotrophomonas sp. 57]|uniref:peptidase domain-containing ABC transporter n=1 Tax=Stenotrophomonas sp. 57 TaxID=3051119 RepID=UPI00256F0A30|nr:peptidase domain-containing ABC transporter [Stenotrophomonas sp. 57]
MRILLQSEAAECGLVALAMIADAHGHSVSLMEMRQRFSFSLKGARLSQIIEAAQHLGLSGRALRLEIENLGELRTPCILHWDLNHFVVLKKASKSGIFIADPAFGEKFVSLESASKHFTGIALELTPNSDFLARKSAPSISIKQLTGKVSGLWKSLISVLGLSLALQVFVVTAPFFLQWTIDQALVSADRDLLTILALGFGLSLAVQVVINLVRGAAVVHLSSQLSIQWMGNIFAHLVRLPLEFFEKRNLGDITSRAASVQSIQRTMTTSFVEAIIDGLMAAVTVGLMLAYSWKLAAISCAAMCIYLACRAAAFSRVRSDTERQLISSARQQGHLLESIRGIQSLKIAGQEASRTAVYNNLVVDSVNREAGLAKLGILFAASSQGIFGFERIAVIWLGAIFALDNIFSVGMLVAYLAYRDQFAQRTGSLIDRLVEFKMLRLHGERLADIALTPPDSIVDAINTPPPAGKIDVRNVSFRYGDGEPWVVRNCSFVIEEGDSLAIVGASGCGKSTLLKLILGLLKPTEGEIFIGEAGVNSTNPENARSHMAAVMQEDQLFAGSISDNISFFTSPVDQDLVHQSAGLASVSEDIEAMPMGYFSLIGDMGSSLSGGQKQRILLARALYRQPKILLLDEATSHLDIVREKLVNDSIKKLSLTRLIIAHRPETIASADRIIVMENGAICQEIVPPRPADREATEQISMA